ncbi:ACP synthase, partial [Halobacterium sp. KA-4]|nr:ACP synthase [Halobacterium sp. KA-4]
MNGIESAGAYVPRGVVSAEEIGEAWDGFRARGISEKRVPGYDEDAVTMAVEAATDALEASSVSREDVETLALGTTTP